LLDSRVDAQAREIALNQELVEFRGTRDGVDEDDELVELEGV
jgi:hypothetical protein